MNTPPILLGWIAAIFLAAGGAELSAQTGAEQTGVGPDQIVQMNAFEVTTTQGHGYVSTNATQGLKTNQSMMDIPQSVLVVTNDMINDIGYSNSTDVLNMLGLGNGFQGESLQVRGVSVGYAYVDDMPTNQNYEDNFWVDTYTVVKGAAEVLYLNSKLSGVIIKSTKKPLPFEQNILTASYDQWGTYRFMLDSTGPIGTVGGAKLSYRFVAVDRGGDQYFHNYSGQYVRGLFPEFQVAFKNTTLRVWYTLEDMLFIPSGGAIITGQGALFQPGGRRGSYLPPNDLEHDQYTRTGFELEQKMSDNWDMRIQASYWNYRIGPTPLVDNGGATADFTAGTMSYTVYEDQENPIYWTMIDDVNGHYAFGNFGSLGPIDNQDAIGFGYSDFLSKVKSYNSPPFGVNGTVTIPLNSQAAVNSVVIPPFSAFGPAANYGIHNDTYLSNIHWQHTIEVVPKHLDLVGGWTWANVATSSVANISTLPFQATNVTLSQWLHRLGAILKLNSNIAFYALNSTTFAPPSGVRPILVTGQLAPPQAGKGNELGMKTVWMGGRISTDFGWFKESLTNNLQLASGLSPITNTSYDIIVGASVEEGVDGDVSMAVLPGWQLVGTFYAGHDRTYVNNPLAGTYDNSWSFFNRYDFPKDSALKGLALGGGITRIGGRWTSSGGIVVSPAMVTPYTQQHGGIIKEHTGTLANAFASYQLTKQFRVQVRCDNIFDEAYPLGAQEAEIIDPSPPLTFAFLVEFKY